MTDTYRDALDEIAALRAELEAQRECGEQVRAEREYEARRANAALTALAAAEADIHRLLNPTAQDVTVIGGYTITGLDPSGVQVDGGQP